MSKFAAAGAALFLATLYSSVSAQLSAPAQSSAQLAPPLVLTPVRPIQPPAHPLPPEEASAGATRFSFIAYGDTRCDCRLDATTSSATLLPAKPEVELEHDRVVDAVLAKVKTLAATNYPVKFIVQSGDGVWRGPDADRWNEVFTPIVERITRGADLPFFFVPGNHDVTGTPVGDPQHSLGLHNTLSAISRVIPPEGSPRRLSGYGTFSFGYGSTFVIGFDSNIAADALQYAWVADQLEHLDRARYRHVVALFHHPAYTSGRYSGVAIEQVLPNGQTVSGGGTVSQEARAMRAKYMPLFRRHHVKLLLAGHDHLFDHWVERYVDNGVAYRMDQIISGGGGAPAYVYTGEPNLQAYLAEGRDQQLRVEHLAKPGTTVAENPHHFVVIQVDGDRLSLEVIGTGPTAFTPYNGSATIELNR